jgi:hypothetical protein
VAINVIEPVGDPRGDLIVGDYFLPLGNIYARISERVRASCCSSSSDPHGSSIHATILAVEGTRRRSTALTRFRYKKVALSL